ncbi:5-carboxymethyl-2-hydroxymuconate Delta-isomerase [Legionella hackeliae]|uniref:Putative 5-carboxymethyl-2-hydroxymuconate Delta-isomerase n=1 Tax=Legionella hackeliae TaxID=449 RepID=A0A0A8UKW8_LEGHA|nr:5-carboxymethyl-2-hydroxymuconate Delta-isomerase [Legionella hackeliae]KTD14864.1 5-carboxymethyl-2-hydroxymuconate Delta-isomerase [Legionella hackeliae]CEK09510.1 putative 5-carboxymethyl-2-hydroxymuconate Delta-isomerase [Legionella hackeliae]STX49417.1 5-carboxymethyl-2-hydroxymuconate Delta-isomerase [Legionella hackeliae]
MPHLTLEYSSNIIEKDKLLSFFSECHAILATSLPANLASCKSRALCSDIFYIADGDSKHAFIHLDIKVMAGRSDETLQSTAHQLMELLNIYFEESMKKFQLQISIEISELGEFFLKSTR